MREAQYVVPRAKHCVPEAIAKRRGVLERSVPATVPRRRPNTPAGKIKIVSARGLGYFASYKGETARRWMALRASFANNLQIDECYRMRMSSSPAQSVYHVLNEK